MATLPAFDELTQDQVSVREYLTTSYRPDCDYVDGRLEERTVGEFDHGTVQALLTQIILNHGREWGVMAATEVRMRVSKTRFRIPDVLVVRRDAPREPVLTHPPLLAIEVLSSEDRMSPVQVRIDDFLSFGIENIWIVDPARRTGFRATADHLQEAEDGILSVPGTPIRIDLKELFAALDQA